MKKSENEYSCIAQFGRFFAYIVTSIVWFLFFVGFIVLVTMTENIETIIIGSIMILASVLLGCMSIHSAIQESKHRFIINYDTCTYLTKNSSISIPTASIRKIEIVRIFRDTKNIFVYIVTSKNEENQTDYENEQVIKLYYSRKRVKRIGQYCRNGVISYKD